MIAVAAYFLAERRDFAPGGESQDWLAAERAIDAMIAEGMLGRAMIPEARQGAIRNALVLQGD